MCCFAFDLKAVIQVEAFFFFSFADFDLDVDFNHLVPCLSIELNRESNMLFLSDFDLLDAAVDSFEFGDVGFPLAPSLPALFEADLLAACCSSRTLRII